jgi:Na+-translocating ferredoxin:NAD+ oxidoreductase subunit C
LYQKAIRRLLGKPEFRLALETRVSGTVSMDCPALLQISRCIGGGEPQPAAVEVGEEVTAGQPLAGRDDGYVIPSPTSGTIKEITEQPDIRRSRRGGGVIVEPTAGVSPVAFEKLDLHASDPDVLANRLNEAGILSSIRAPEPLLAQLRPAGDQGVDTLVVLAADRDPGVSVALQLLRERTGDAADATILLGRIAGAKRVVLALLESETTAVPDISGVEVIPLPAEYPETLVGMVARRLGGGAGIRVVPLESALAALDAVRDGRVPEKKLLTVIGPDQKPIANYLVYLGTTVHDILAHAGIEVAERDKVVVGGPMRGFAVYSLDGTIDAGVDALTVIPADRFAAWSSEPCINCGRCIDICPIDLQVPLLARYAEFEFFEQAQELGLDQCFECGLCAAFCTARRPLLQYIRLAKKGLEDSA